MIAIFRGSNGGMAGGPLARAPRAPAGPPAETHLDLNIQVAAENVAAKRTASQMLGERGPGRELDREL